MARFEMGLWVLVSWFGGPSKGLGLFISLGGFELFLWVWFEILSVLWRKRGSFALFADVKDPIIILAVLFGVVGLVFALDLLIAAADQE